MPMTGAQDVDFAVMSIHYEGAIHIAEPQVRLGKNPQMRSLANEIISVQRRKSHRSTNSWPSVATP